jgi:nitroreductase
MLKIKTSPLCTFQDVQPDIQLLPPSRPNTYLLMPGTVYFVAECTYFIAGVADPALKWHQVDITIAFTNFTLQATELGYGTCWIGAFSETMVKELLGVPKERKVVVCMTFGMPKGKHFAKGRKAIEDFVYLNSYGHPWNPMK